MACISVYVHNGTTLQPTRMKQQKKKKKAQESWNQTCTDLVSIDQQGTSWWYNHTDLFTGLAGSVIFNDMGLITESHEQERLYVDSDDSLQWCDSFNKSSEWAKAWDWINEAKDSRWLTLQTLFLCSGNVYYITIRLYICMTECSSKWQIKQKELCKIICHTRSRLEDSSRFASDWLRWVHWQVPWFEVLRHQMRNSLVLLEYMTAILLRHHKAPSDNNTVNTFQYV